MLINTNHDFVIGVSYVHLLLTLLNDVFVFHVVSLQLLKNTDNSIYVCGWMGHGGPPHSVLIYVV